jgi:DNA-binding transcriptional MerR regulator
MKIEQVARITGLSVHTLRYYERAGLYLSVPRARNGHRDYSEDDVYIIRFITRLRAADMPIAKIQRYMELARQGDATAAERLQIMEEHRRDIEQEIAMLQEHLGVINGKIEHYRAINQPRSG